MIDDLMSAYNGMFSRVQLWDEHISFWFLFSKVMWLSKIVVFPFVNIHVSPAKLSLLIVIIGVNVHETYVHVLRHYSKV